MGGHYQSTDNLDGDLPFIELSGGCGGWKGLLTSCPGRHFDFLVIAVFIRVSAL
jgi:hypothetical protein